MGRLIESAYKHAVTVDLLTACNETNWMDTLCHIQPLVLFSSLMLLVTVPYSHIVLCLDNRASAWHCLCVEGSFIAAAELSSGILKRHRRGSMARAFSRPFSNMKSIYRCPAWAGCRLKPFYCVFSDDQQTAMQTQGGCLFQRMTKVPVHVEHSGTKQLKQCTDKDSPVSLTCVHHHQTYTAETIQTACVLR